MRPEALLVGDRMVAAVLVVVAASWMLVVVTLGASVTRARVERFARRQRLAVTAGNGPHIIRYLATTRRWRSAGVVAGLALPAILTVPDELQISIALIPLLSGWFVGALLSEARVTHLAYGARRAASLTRRGAERYLPRTVIALVPVATGLCLVTAAVTVIAAAMGREVPAGPAAVPLVLGLGVAVAVWLMQRRAVRRPQPLASPDVLAADDAIRSRSLHVLSAAGAVLITYCLLAQLDALLGPGAWALPFGLASLLVAAAGWVTATGAWQASPTAGPPPTAVTAGAREDR